MISVKNIAGIICFFAYSKTTAKEKYRMQKEKYRRAEEKEALGKSASCEYTGKDEMKIVVTIQRDRSLSALNGYRWRNICWTGTSGSRSLTSWKNFMEKFVFLRKR